LNEVAAAKVCLLTPEKKAAYDAKLRETLSQQPSVEDSEQRFSQEMTELVATAQAAKAGRSTRKGDSREPLPPPVIARTSPSHPLAKGRSTVVVGATAAGGVMLLGFVWLMLRGGHEMPRAEVAAGRTQARGEGAGPKRGAAADMGAVRTDTGIKERPEAEPVAAAIPSPPPTVAAPAANWPRCARSSARREPAIVRRPRCTRR
jgi:hypothetical protein